MFEVSSEKEMRVKTEYKRRKHKMLIVAVFECVKEMELIMSKPAEQNNAWQLCTLSFSG